MATSSYDYIIVGSGLAGLQLALAIQGDAFFSGRSIAIIDPSSKNTNDKTWCYWEKGEGQWDALITRQWHLGEFASNRLNKTLDLAPYCYKMLRSIDFYQYALSKLSSDKSFHIINDYVENIDALKCVVTGKKSSYTAQHIFDSIPPEDYKTHIESTKIFQHFKGITIEAKNEVFDCSKFTMMDYRIPFKDSTCFTYVLPLTPTTALVEFTFFTSFLTKEKIYDQKLDEYIHDILEIKEYKILESEIGVIPMTDYPFHQNNSRHVTKIGTAGGWVKASSGYSFKHTEKKVSRLIFNLKHGKDPSSDLYNKRFQWYDSIFLDVLDKRNDLGPMLFTKMYTRNKPEDIFKFLDEETSYAEDVKIMLSMYHPQFLRSFFSKV